MNEEPFSSIPRRRPLSLIDLVGTKTPEASRAFVTQATQIAEAAGGRVAVANEAIAPMIVLDERDPPTDASPLSRAPASLFHLYPTWPRV